MYVYTVSGTGLTEKTQFQLNGDITALAYSPSEEYLAVTDSRNVLVYDTASFQVCMHACACVRVCTLYMHACVCACVHVCVSVCVRVYACICVCVCVCVCAHVCMQYRSQNSLT